MSGRKSKGVDCEALPKTELRNISKNTNILVVEHWLRKQFFCNSTSHSPPRGRTGRPLLPQSSPESVHRLVGHSLNFSSFFFRLIFGDFGTPHSPRHDFLINPQQRCSLRSRLAVRAAVLHICKQAASTSALFLHQIVHLHPRHRG